MTSAIDHEDLWIATPDGRMFARRWSRGRPVGTPVVLFHDSLGSVELWRDFPAKLAAATGREVVAYDRLGFGNSDPYPGDLPKHFVRDEAERFFPLLRQQLGIERFVAFGHSVGGSMGATCAWLFPRDCEALITESAQAFVEGWTLHGIRQAKEAFAEPGQMERLRKYHGAKADWVLSAWTETWLSEAFADWTIESHAPSVGCPLLVIHGEQDEYGSLAHPQRIVGLAAAHCESLLLDDCHHVPHREQPAAVLEAVDRFLRIASR